MEKILQRSFFISGIKEIYYNDEETDHCFIASITFLSSFFSSSFASFSTCFSQIKNSKQKLKLFLSSFYSVSWYFFHSIEHTFPQVYQQHVSVPLFFTRLPVSTVTPFISCRKQRKNGSWNVAKRQKTD